ncbi:uncharacterized protein BDZ99DRAFT_502167 [Mytilinidion resinicola]|uniref:Zinc-binding loop region of homing endonuclease domain-containing protein n=1 Tax=Mytilinidion resinicola TaxID=574789 RepID=A0A6A6Y9M6_9PEZI|nr:uncharacterized protein BDZ99DRAFT_502167 [Mytilinidion resinicola]KAF2805329.1 hypothetical protein BDZ99DRAFT_502167 [Mytilinidion resinicola]
MRDSPHWPNRSQYPRFDDEEKEVQSERLLKRKIEKRRYLSDDEGEKAQDRRLPKRRRADLHWSDESDDGGEGASRKRLGGTLDRAIRRSGLERNSHSPAKVPPIGAYAAPESSQEVAAPSTSNPLGRLKRWDPKAERPSPKVKPEDLKRRQRHFLFKASKAELEKVELHVSTLRRKVHTTNKDACWLLPHYAISRSANGSISWRTQFQDSQCTKQRVTFSYGIFAKLVEGSLTPHDKEMIIEKSWELSHRCHNWTCLNTRHFAIESHAANMRRRKCFHLFYCSCKPKCLSDLKKPNKSLSPPSPGTKALANSISAHTKQSHVQPPAPATTDCQIVPVSRQAQAVPGEP